MKACPECGVQNADDAFFCRACNSFLDWSQDTSESGPEPYRGEKGELRPEPVAGPPATSVAAAPPGPVGIPTPPIATSPHPPVPPTPPTAVAGAASVAGTLQVLADGRRLAERRHREDLVAQLDAARSRLGERTMTVALVGEFKKGKSTLVNALLQTAVCPVDADVVTVVPTMICYGETPSAIAHFEKVGQSDQPVSTAVPIESIAEFVSEIGNPGNARHLRSLEIRLPHRLLKSGLRLIDTPGVGGLDSAHGIVTLGVLDQVDGIIFVTDASAELNQPELTFLRSALERCPQAACVMTKIDLYPHWRRIRARNAAHLTAAGLDLPLIAVSSFLRLRARRRPELLTESGFTALVEFLGRSVAGRANTAATQVAAQQADFVATQLAHEVRAEQAVLVEPARAEELVEELTSARNRAAGLASPTASWQQVLTDGVQDLVADVQHDLQERLRAVLRDAEALIDRADPKDSWDDVEEWLRRQAVTAAIANYDALKEQATDLARYVAESFDLEAGQAISWESLAPPEGLQQLSLASVETLRAPGGRLGSMLMATRTAVFVPMALFGVAGSLLGAVVMVPVTLILVGGIGQKLIRDERKRQIAHRQQQARAAARRFVDEVGFIMNKETQDALRRTQRQLRDDFQQRAAAIHRSSVSALDVAARAARMTGADRRDRVAELSAQTTALSAISRTLQSAVSGG